MARKDDLASSIGRFLKKHETVVGACRAAPRGGVVTSALLAGAGATIGYTLATFVGEGGLAAAIGGGAGAAAGVVISSMVSSWRMRKKLGMRAAVVTMALTQRRLLMFRQSWLNNRVADLVGDFPLDSITSLVVGKARLFAPAPMTITLTDGDSMEFESAKIERPDLFAEAFEQATGG